ncbi:MAG TPA: thioredoxin family protein [bacterium]|nr:thioredoxin family protein [bacterium]
MLSIKVVGSGCPNCQKLESLCKEVVEEGNMDARIEKVTDMNKFADLGVFLTPGLIIDGEVKSSGSIPRESVLLEWLQDPSTGQSAG